ncbi:MAG TPA: ORF6N domain-containing protein, partial [Clostridiales bacterium]|nr:ORF6N domain-containing protein [Clostridiales bacterium]
MVKNEVEKFDESIIRDRIYSIRGYQVMLDRDLAELYGVKPFRLREQVKRNKKRFPDDFVFRLNKNEISYMVSQNAIPSKQSLGGSNPYVFTEQGVAALSSILTSDVAIDISIRIMRAFVAMRKFIQANGQIFQRLDRVEVKL